MGLAAAGGTAPAAWCVAVALALAFLARDPLVARAVRRRSGRQAPGAWFRARLVWGAGYLAGALLAFAAAVALTPPATRPALLTLAALAAAGGLVHAVAEILGAGRVAALELAGMAGAVLAVPLMAAAAGRPPSPAVVGLAAPPFAYFASSLAWVRAYRALSSDRTGATLRCLALHVAIAAGLLLANALGAVSPLGLAAFAPALARTVVGLAAPPRNLKAVGLREVWVAVATAIVAAAAAV